jgi:hypothetical protein
MALKFLKTAASLMPTHSVKYLLHQHLTGYEIARPIKNVHASELTKGLCPRYYAILDKEPKLLRDNWLSTSENVTYRIGRELQDAVVHWLADQDKAITDWKCRACDDLYMLQKRPKKCQCGCSKFDPQEHRFASELSGASCGVDVLVQFGAGKLRVVEIKTMDKDQFKALQMPLAEHRLRTNLYLRLIAESGLDVVEQIDTQVATVLYVSKGGYGCADPTLKQMGIGDSFSPFKEFVIQRDDKATDAMMQRAKVVLDYRKKKVGMPCGICATAMEPAAKKCSAVKACFSGQYPAEYEWQ